MTSENPMCLVCDEYRVRPVYNAAPELLRALKALVRSLDDREHRSDAICAAYDAIAKAEGRV